MLKLVCLQLKRMALLKGCWIYFFAMVIMFLTQSWNAPAEALGSDYYPVAALQLQASVIGPLFLALTASYAINQEKKSGMFKQPLLYGYTKKQLLDSKMISLVLAMAFCYFSMESIGFLQEYLIKGGITFEAVQFCLIRIFLTFLPMAVHCIGLVLLALYTSAASVTLSAALLIFLADNLVSQFFPEVVSKFSYFYYAYAFCEFNYRPLKEVNQLLGISLCLLTGVGFYFLSYRKIKKLVF